MYEIYMYLGRGYLPGVSDHERHFLRGHGLGGDDEIAFIFAIYGIQHDDELSVS